MKFYPEITLEGINIEKTDIILVRVSGVVSEDFPEKIAEDIKWKLSEIKCDKNIGIFVLPNGCEFTGLSMDNFMELNLVPLQYIYDKLGQESILKLGYKKANISEVEEKPANDSLIKKYVIKESKDLKAFDLCKLYGVKIEECYVNEFPKQDENNLIFLYPKLNGDYSSPTRKGR
jgi:hypothetical protein